MVEQFDSMSAEELDDIKKRIEAKALELYPHHIRMMMIGTKWLNIVMNGLRVLYGHYLN